MLQSQITIVRGDDYYAAEARSLIFSLPFAGETPDLTEAEIRMDFFAQANVDAALSVDGTVENAGTNSQQAVFELSASETAQLTAMNYVAGIIASVPSTGSPPVDRVNTVMRVLVTTSSPGG